jgi:hypothetical protein
MYGCLHVYVYYCFIMLDKGMKSILKNTTTPQNKRDKPGSSFSVDMACQA